MSRFYNLLSHKSYTVTFLRHLPSVVIHSAVAKELISEVVAPIRQASLSLLIVMFGR